MTPVGIIIIIIIINLASELVQRSNFVKHFSSHCYIVIINPTVNSFEDVCSRYVR